MRHDVVHLGLAVHLQLLHGARLVAEDRAVDAVAAVGEAPIRACHLERCGGLRTEADREVALQRGRDPERPRRRGDVARADDRRQLGEDRVVGVRDRLGEVDRPERLTLVVVHFPEAAARVDRHVLRRGEDARRSDSLLQRGREHEGLERRPGLTLALRREVELALVVVLAAHHREHGAGARVERDERRGRARRGGKRRRDRVPRHLLQVHVEGRRHLQAAAEGLPRAEALHELVLHVVREVGGLEALRRGQRHLRRVRHRIDARVHVLAPGQVALDVELAEDDVPPELGGGGVSDRVPEARVLRDPCEEGGLRRLHHRRRVLEVDPCCLLDAVSAVAEVHGVEIRGQDPVLAPLLLELPREGRLDQLAADRLLIRQERVLHELLGDRRASLHGPLVRDIGPEGAPHAANVDAAVLVEALVLDRDDRVLHPR